VEIEFGGDFTASASETEAGYLLLLSKTQRDQIDLLGFELLEISSRISTHLRKWLSQPHTALPLDPIGLRSNLSSTWGSLLTEHVILIHKYLDRDQSDVVAYTAWRYATLTAWGESAGARELSLDMKISVNTIRTRLQLARERGILTAPGAGARLGR
jgi:hypothetical protein